MKGRDLNRSIPVLINWISTKSSASASALYRREFGIGVTEGRVIALLSQEKTATVKRISDVIGADKGTISRAVTVLEQKKLVKTAAHAEDSRQKLIRLTAKGVALCRRTFAAAVARERALLAPFSQEELESLLSMLRRIHARLPELSRVSVAGKRGASKRTKAGSSAK